MTQKLKAMVDKAFDRENLKAMRQELEKNFKIQVEATASSSDENEYPDLAELNDEQWECYLDAKNNLSEMHRKLIKYFFSRKPEQLEADGTLAIDKTYSNWGKNNNFTRPQVRNLLTEMENLFLVKLTDTHWKVRGSLNEQFPDV